MTRPHGGAKTRKEENGNAPLVGDLSRIPRRPWTAHDNENARLLRGGCPAGVRHKARRRQADRIQPRTAAVEQQPLGALSLLLGCGPMPDIYDNRQLQLFCHPTCSHFHVAEKGTCREPAQFPFHPSVTEKMRENTGT